MRVFTLYEWLHGCLMHFNELGKNEVEEWTRLGDENQNTVSEERSTTEIEIRKISEIK